MTAGKEFEGCTVTDRLNRLSILYSKDAFSLTIRQIANGVPNQIKQKNKLVVLLVRRCRVKEYALYRNIIYSKVMI